MQSGSVPAGLRVGRCWSHTHHITDLSPITTSWMSAMLPKAGAGAIWSAPAAAIVWLESRPGG